MTTARPFFKIAIRDEGDFVVAYYAQPRMYADPEHPPLILATFRKTALEHVPGLVTDWQKLLQRAMEGVLKALGIEADGWKTTAGLPDERTGKA